MASSAMAPSIIEHFLLGALTEDWNPVDALPVILAGGAELVWKIPVGSRTNERNYLRGCQF